LVSKVSALTSVREKLVALQRSLAVDVDAVFEGRDMGTVVFPKADLKIFLWGNPEVRAKRRFDELRIKFPKDTENLTLEQTIAEINRRDTYDSTRQISPLKQAQDAYLIDTSDLTLDQVVLKILELKVTRSQ
jgi:cytidylate kinase